MNWFRKNYPSILNILTTLMLGVILILLINVQSQNAGRLKDQEKILKGLKQATDELKDSNARQTRFIECLLAAHGEEQLVGADVQIQCEKMANNVGIEDVTKPVSQSSNSDTQTPTTSTNDTPPRRSPISPAVDALNKVIKVLTVCTKTPLGKVCI